MGAMNQEEVVKGLKEFILKEFLPGENPDELTNSTALVTTSILDSVGTLKLVMFLENTYNIKLSAHETDVEYMNTIDSIAKLVCSKK
jgi:acyl carrier protein